MKWLFALFLYSVDNNIWTSWRSLYCQSKPYTYLIFMSQIYLYLYPVTNYSNVDELTCLNSMKAWIHSLIMFWKLKIVFTSLVQRSVTHVWLLNGKHLWTMRAHKVFSWFHPRKLVIYENDNHKIYLKPR